MKISASHIRSKTIAGSLYAGIYAEPRNVRLLRWRFR
jgi:hypothetical protein